MENFNTRLVTSIPLIIIGIISIIYHTNIIYLFIGSIFFLIFLEWNYLFLKKFNYFISLHLFLILLLQIILFLQSEFVYLFIIINLCIIILINIIYKFKYIYLFTSIYFLISLLSIFSFLNKTNNSKIIILIFLIVISFDSFSYIFGKIFKGKKIIPKISPGKTFSGYFFGIIFTLILIFILNYYFNFYLNLNKLFLISIIIIS